MVDTDTLFDTVGIVITEEDGIKSIQLKYPLFRIIVEFPVPSNIKIPLPLQLNGS